VWLSNFGNPPPPKLKLYAAAGCSTSAVHSKVTKAIFIAPAIAGAADPLMAVEFAEDI